MDDLTIFLNFLKNKKCTLLGVGPMSKNCVDVVIDLANRYDIPIMLIASRRQIESVELGKGYVNNWSTEEFSKYVNQKNPKHNVILCRDHGGPYQNENENKQKISFNKIMENTKKSFRTDIKSGFKIIHIDPSNDLTSEITLDEMLRRIFELYEYCYEVSKELKNEIFIEVSIGKEDGGISTLSEIKYTVFQIEKFCNQKNLPLPLFLVVRTGNHVMEMKNVGIFEDILSKKIPDEELKLKEIVDFCNSKKIMIKVHNGDYLSDSALKSHLEFGFHAMNVAPEFGVLETKAILSWLSKNNLEEFKEKILDIAYESQKWEKWILPNSVLERNEKAVIAGHYVFSNEKFIKLKTEILNQIENKNDFDNFLKDEIRNGIMRYLFNFNLI